jgi:hypothetical protein
MRRIRRNCQVKRGGGPSMAKSDCGEELGAAKWWLLASEQNLRGQWQDLELELERQ